MGASLACGVAASAAADGWVIALADMPWIEAGTIGKVAAAVAQGAPIAVPVVAGRRGHPVGFGAAFRDALTALGGDRGAKRLLEAHPHAVREIVVADRGILRDVDTPEDLAR